MTKFASYRETFSMSNVEPKWRLSIYILILYKWNKRNILHAKWVHIKPFFTDNFNIKVSSISALFIWQCTLSMVLVWLIKYYCWFVLREWISQSNFTSKAKPEMYDTTRSPYWAKHTKCIYDSMFIEDLVRCRHYNITLENSNIMLTSF